MNDRSKLELAREFRTPDWSQAHLIHLELPEYHYETKPGFANRDVPLSPVLVDQFMQAIQQLLQDEATLSPTEKQKLAKLYQTIGTYHRWITKPIQPRSTLEQVASSLPDTATKDTISQINDIPDLLRRNQKNNILFTSSSHAVAAAVMESAATAGWQTGDTTAILSFDHHSDFSRGLSIRPSRLNKANVMTYLLQEKLASQVAVVGVRRRSPLLVVPKNAHLVLGQDLYRDHQPNRALFQVAMKRIYQNWKHSGIKHIYPTIDLDGLRLPEQRYTATDYNPIDEVFSVVQGFHTLLTIGCPTNQYLLEYIRSIEPYYGLPAAWVIQALEMAKQYGLQIGLRHGDATNTQRIIGDINEYVGPDFNGRTARIAKGLVAGALAAAGSPSSRNS